MTVTSIRRNHRSAISAALMTVGIVAAAMTPGCGSQEQYGVSHTPPKVNRVDWITFSHKVNFASGGTALTNGERARFEHFLSEIAVGFADQVSLAIPGAAGSGAQTAERRIGSIGDYLKTRAIRSNLAPENARGAWDGSVIVTVGRYVATPPPCPNWEKPPGYDFTNTEMSNLGCASTTNLGLMIADPGDLVRARRLGPADGTMQARGVETLREGKSESANASITGTAGKGSSKSAAGTESITGN